MPSVLSFPPFPVLPDPLSSSQRHKTKAAALFTAPTVDVDSSLRLASLSASLRDGGARTLNMSGAGVNTLPYQYGGPTTYTAPSASMPSYKSNGGTGPKVDPVAYNTVPTKRPQNPPSASREGQTMDSQRNNEGNSIASYLQIPSSINDSKGSLAEFAAQITCLFWFEKTSKLKSIEDSSCPLRVIPPLLPEAIPTMGFQKWVTTILSTTQVSQNVILLALLFVYRLKLFNPGVRGKKGSEFRLMTIALMMGNKFLDDNTYTNKTWAEVSGISVQEIHIMEVEFLSNVRYNLYVSKEEWKRWHVKLGMFAAYFDRASRMPSEQELSPPTPTKLHISPTTLPTSPRPLGGSSPLGNSSPSPSRNSFMPSQQWSQPMSGIPFPRLSPNNYPIRQPEMAPSSRKRSWDAQEDEHPIKRQAVSNPSAPMALPAMPPLVTPSPVIGLPLAPTSNPPLHGLPATVSAPYLPRPQIHSNTHPPETCLSSHLPLPTGRPMPIPAMYHPTTSWPQHNLAPTSAAPVPVSLPNMPITLPEPSRRQSPFASSAQVSPALSAYSVHTPQTHLSPSFFLTNRDSPYRPVRSVNTLLIPPTASLQHPRTLPFDQMHYQPLGKAISERRTGVLPYIQQDAWPQAHIPQPNFGHHTYSG